MSDNSSKIMFGEKLPKTLPKVSFGKYLFDRMKRGNQDVALVDAHTGNTITYDQILQRSVKLAYYFKMNNVTKGDVIAIISENDISYIIPTIAALYMGVTVHPMNVNLTLDELSAMLQVSQPKLIFCSETALELVEKSKSQFLFIETIVTFGFQSQYGTSLEELLQTNGTDLFNFEPEEVNPENDVAVIFSSSGTTGLPKSVMLTHCNLVYMADILFGYSKFRQFQRGDTTLIPVPFCHIYGFIYLIGNLSKIRKCILMKKFVPELYLKSIELYKVTKLPCPPLLLKFLAQSPLVENYDLSSINDITYGSAPSDPAIDSIITKRLNVIPRQIYGATETSGSCLSTPIGFNKLGSCGIVVPGLMVKICDIDSKTVLGANQCGEICVKGPNLMKGYMGNLEETKICIDGDGFYHTGDIGYYDEDGYFFITDRLKDLIKYKGYQVSPTELENLLLKHTAIKEAAVIGIPDDRAGEVPLAYVVVDQTCNRNITEKAIVEFVAERISAGKRLYGGVKFLKDIPKNENGKALRNTLRKMYNKSLTT